MQIINIYLITINITSIILMGIDKLQAIRNKKRISEFNLLALNALGSSLGTLLGMIIFKHKTQKIKFKIMTPIFLIIQIFIYNQIKRH